MIVANHVVSSASASVRGERVAAERQADSVQARDERLLEHDLAHALMPNGHTLEYVADAPYLARGRIGVWTLSR